MPHCDRPSAVFSRLPPIVSLPIAPPAVPGRTRPLLIRRAAAHLQRAAAADRAGVREHAVRGELRACGDLDCTALHAAVESHRESSGVHVESCRSRHRRRVSERMRDRHRLCAVLVERAGVDDGTGPAAAERSGSAERRVEREDAAVASAPRRSGPSMPSPVTLKRPALVTLPPLSTTVPGTLTTPELRERRRSHRELACHRHRSAVVPVAERGHRTVDERRAGRDEACPESPRARSSRRSR